MRTLIVGIGALGGLIAARLQVAGAPVWLAARNAESAAHLRTSGLRVTGVGGDASARSPEVAALEDYSGGESFDLIVLATKAQDAMEAAPRLVSLLAPGGTLLPIQNGGVSQILAERHGSDRVLGGLSNLGATMSSPGCYEQRNAGHLLIGELAGDGQGRAERVRTWLGQAVDVRVTANMRGAAWSKLLVNCSVTTIGAVAGRTMRDYIGLPEGRALFDRAYDEALAVALASGARPERMFADPVPPGWAGQSMPGTAHEAWIGQILSAYGDLKPSMLQDFERGRATEIDFINGYVVDLGRRFGVETRTNAAIVAAVHSITRGELRPGPGLLGRLLGPLE
ncbi:ketopantoate reductase family protein [Geothrix sp. PMB-07]|uniref:ketopantoate reductase family protein n=1 Tax=Geothrix sp. PMB-07 TaxID=3068640 RepID=UPI0027424A4F|nr:2-dehydropantoate 2-reductase [Geothrix sp. PMB-07]WLT30445.1 2-dehydropantoate 2-reductase [Geothrix sp. PMB-07]